MKVTLSHSRDKKPSKLARLKKHSCVVGFPPFLTLDDRRNTISAGNPDLKATHANNYDLLYKHYPKPIGCRLHACRTHHAASSLSSSQPGN